MNRLRAGAIVTIPTRRRSASDADAGGDAHRAHAGADWRNYRDRVAGAAPEVGGQRSARVERSHRRRGPKTARRPPRRDRDKLQRVARSRRRQGRRRRPRIAIAREKQLKDAQTRIAALEKTIARDAAASRAAGSRRWRSSQAHGRRGARPQPAAPRRRRRAAAAAAPATAAVAASRGDRPRRRPPRRRRDACGTRAPAQPKAERPRRRLRQAAAGFFDDLFSNTPQLGDRRRRALAVLGGIAALIAARRRKGTKFEDSIISGTDIKTNTVFGSTGGGVVNTGDNSLASDFSREGLGNIDTDEVDPIAEAEVYLAYGRDAQAEEILKDALKKDPQRQEIYLKLLEIHAQHNKPQAFETVAAELFAVSHGQGDVWHEGGDARSPARSRPIRCSQDGAAASPPREAAAPPPRPWRRAAALAAARRTGVQRRRHLDRSRTTAQAAKSPADILAGAEDALARSSSEHARGRRRARGDAVGSGDRRRGSGRRRVRWPPASRSLAQAASDLSTRVDTPAESPRFDLDFHLDDADSPAPLKPAPEAMSEPSPASAPAQFGHPGGALELDKLDLSFDPERPTFEDPTPSVLDGQWHDAATKLDLAKAYQEMGDVEGAREILQEVLHEGDDQQKSEAQSAAREARLS